MEFKFIEFNPRRAARGAPAARFEIFIDGNGDWIWMDKRDIRENRKIYGDNPEFDKAIEAYKKGGVS
jgi:hypothetical protein